MSLYSHYIDYLTISLDSHLTSVCQMMVGWVVVWMNGWLDGCVDVCMYGWMDVCRKQKLLFVLLQYRKANEASLHGCCVEEMWLLRAAPLQEVYQWCGGAMWDRSTDWSLCSQFWSLEHDCRLMGYLLC